MSGVMTTVLAKSRTSRFRNSGAESFDEGATSVETPGERFGEDRGYGWIGFRDVPLGTAEAGSISEVITGPGGIFVIDHVAGEESIVVEGGELRRDGEPAAELAARARDAAAVIQAELPPHVRALVQPVLCLDGANSAFGWSADVMICSPVTLAPMMNSRPPLVTETRVNEIAEHLGRRYPFEEESVEGLYAGGGLDADLDFEAALLGASLVDPEHPEYPEHPKHLEHPGGAVGRVAPVAPAAPVASPVGAPDDDSVIVAGTAGVAEAQGAVVVGETEAPGVAPKPKRVAPKRRKEPTAAQKALQLLWLVALLVVAVVLGLWIV